MVRKSSPRQQLSGGGLFPARGNPKPLRASKRSLSRAQSKEEDDHLISFFVWVKQWRDAYPVLARAFHTENEGALVGERRTYTRKSDGVTYDYSPAGVKRRLKGVRAGVPDIINLSARRGFHGLVIELKVLDGKHSAEQLAELAWLRAEGYAVHTCWCWSEAALLCCWYFEITEARVVASAGKPSMYLLPQLGGHNERCGCEVRV